MSSISFENSRVVPNYIENKKYIILKRHAPEYAAMISKYTQITDAVASIIADYVVEGELMDRKTWQKYYSVDIGPEDPNIREALKFEHFYHFYHGPNPIDPIRQVCESCLVPTIVPQYVTRSRKSCDFSLKVLTTIEKQRKIGHREVRFEDFIRFNFGPDPFEQHGMTKVGQSRLVILLKGVIARNQDWDDQVKTLQALNIRTGYRCETNPDALSQNTVVIAHHAITGERALGDTMARTVELVSIMRQGGFMRREEEIMFRMTSGNFGHRDHSPLAELTLHFQLGIINGASETCGVVVMRKF